MNSRRTAALLAGLALLSTSCSQLVDMTSDLPKLTRADLRFKLAESSKIYDSDGRLITTLHGVEDRTLVDLKDIPIHVRRAVIAIEDQRFFEHDGVDLRAIIRAALTNAAQGEVREGGSTITQQYVKNVIIAPGETAEKTLERKLDEAALSRQLEQRLSKKEILGRYLNTVYFGAGAYGIEAAAHAFYGKPVSKLNLAEGAVLAGLIRSPETYNPLDNPDRARLRRDTVLNKMVSLGWAERREVRKIKDQKLRLAPARDRTEYPAAYFIDYVQRLIKFDPRFATKEIGKTFDQRQKALLQGGLRIYTTVDLDMQQAAEESVRSILPYESDPHGSLVAIDPTTGFIKAMVGGRNFFARKKDNQFAKLNLAIQGEPNLGSPEDGGHAPGTGRQAGSAFKTFALVAAIEQGVSLDEMYSGPSCKTFPEADNGGPWTPCNYESGAYGKIPLIEATIKSVNTVFAGLTLDIGPANVAEAAARMGIRTPLSPVASIALGTNEVSPLGMASAYGTLATNGVHHDPIAITRIEDSGGEVLYQAEDDPDQALEPAAAYITTSALEQVIVQGTGVAAGIGRPAAGKTGTAQEYRDAWFVGYTPNMVASVWVGFPEGEIEMKGSCVGATSPCREVRLETVTGGSWPAEIWGKFMLQALSGIPADDFLQPDGITTIQIDIRKRRCLATSSTPSDSIRSITIIESAIDEYQECGYIRDRGVPAQVPDVIGWKFTDAVPTLEERGFEVDVVDQYDTTYPPNTVIDQSPAGGETARTGSTVVIYISTRDDDAQASDDESPQVPNVLGLTEGAALSELESEGFSADVVQKKESNKEAAKQRRGLVWKQKPAGGYQTEEGSTVTIWVNPG